MEKGNSRFSYQFLFMTNRPSKRIKKGVSQQFSTIEACQPSGHSSSASTRPAKVAQTIPANFAGSSSCFGLAFEKGEGKKGAAREQIKVHSFISRLCSAAYETYAKVQCVVARKVL
jgi:hypothetical protein